MDDPIKLSVQWLQALPKLTRYYFLQSLLLSLLCSLQVLDFSYFHLDPTTFQYFQLWRFYTSILIIDKLSLNLLFSLYLSQYFMSRVEDRMFHAKRASLYVFVIFLVTLTVSIGWIFSIALLHDVLLMALITIWCRSRPQQTIDVMKGVNIESGYFPIVYLGFSVLIGKPLIVMVLGIIIGYCYIFLKVTVKENYGVDVLKPAAFLVRWAGNDEVQISRVAEKEGSKEGRSRP